MAKKSRREPQKTVSDQVDWRKRLPQDRQKNPTFKPAYGAPVDGAKSQVQTQALPAPAAAQAEEPASPPTPPAAPRKTLSAPPQYRPEDTADSAATKS